MDYQTYNNVDYTDKLMWKYIAAIMKKKKIKKYYSCFVPQSYSKSCKMDLYSILINECIYLQLETSYNADTKQLKIREVK
jgi:hypothetical protein